MKVLIIYFSGTGNTKKVAEEYRKAFEAQGAEIDLKALPLAEGIDYESYDLVGFGYPIHGFNAPANVLRFAKLLPKLQSEKRAFIFKSSGEPVRMSDVSSLKLIKLLKKRGFSVTNEYQYCMPYNIIFRHTDEMAFRMWDTVQKVVPYDCREILSGTPKRVRKLFMGGFFAWILRAEHWGGRLIGRGYKVTKDCIHCGKCAKNCPEQNIRIDEKGKFHFGKECLICMRCSFNCPTDAFKLGLLNSWKVNGAYSFLPPAEDAPQQKDKHAKYCAKAYKRYFAEAERKINAE